MAELRSLSGNQKNDKPQFPKGFDIGAVVTLKMGGVLMVVTELFEGSPLMVQCEWHADGFAQERSYRVDVLRLARKKEYEEIL